MPDEASYILDHLDTLKVAHVTRQYETSKGFWEKYGKEGYSKALQDAEYHFRFLTESLKAEDPSIFYHYSSWLKSLFAGLSFPPDTIHHTLKVLAEVLKEHLPANLLEVPLSYVTGALDFIQQSPLEVQSFLIGDSPLDTIARSYLQYLLEGEKNKAFALIEKALEQGYTWKEIYLLVFQRTQQEIGRLWQLNLISVAQEHFCTAATQHIMAYLYPRLFRATRKNRKDKRLVIACAGKELHELGARMVADFFELEGWDTYYIGANTPAGTIVQIVQKQKPDILGLSVTLPFYLDEIRTIIPMIRASNSNIKIIVGGYPFKISPNLWKAMGADGYGKDAEHAIEIVNTLIGTVP